MFENATSFASARNFVSTHALLLHFVLISLFELKVDKMNRSNYTSVLGQTIVCQQ